MRLGREVHHTLLGREAHHRKVLKSCEGVALIVLARSQREHNQQPVAHRQMRGLEEEGMRIETGACMQ